MMSDTETQTPPTEADKPAGPLAGVITGTVIKPRRLLVYGVHGVGKTTFAAGAPAPIFVETEEGSDGLDVSRFKLAKTYNDVMDSLRALARGGHEFKTVVLDSLDRLERLIWAEVCETVKHPQTGAKVERIEDYGYGKGYTYAADKFDELLGALDFIRYRCGMNVVLIAHEHTKKVENPEGDAYDRHEPMLHARASALVQQWTDEVFFACYEMFVTQKTGDFGRKTSKATGSGERIMRIEERPAYLAKNRLAITDGEHTLPLSWDAYAEHFPGNQATQQEAE